MGQARELGEVTRQRAANLPEKAAERLTEKKEQLSDTKCKLPLRLRAPNNPQC